MEYQSLTGLSQGDFTLLRILKDGSMQDILTLLTDDYTDAEIDAMLADLVSNSALTTALLNYFTKSQVTALLSGKLSTSALAAGDNIQISGGSSSVI